jgi:hypothetical protein
MVLAIVVLGGMGSQLGVMLAAIAITALPELAREFNEYRMLAFGLVMVLMMIWRPQGLVPATRPPLELPEHAEATHEPRSRPGFPRRTGRSAFAGSARSSACVSAACWRWTTSNFDVRRGQIFAIIGPNGAGKTTVFNCVGGFYRPTSGSVALDGQPINICPAIASPGWDWCAPSRTCGCSKP